MVLTKEELNFRICFERFSFRTLRAVEGLWRHFDDSWLSFSYSRVAV